MRLVYKIIFLSFCCSNVFSQTISGEVKNSKNQLVPYANVYLKLESGFIADFCRADDEGKYELKTSKKGKFNIVFSSLNHEPFQIAVELKSDSDDLKINASLTYVPIELNQVVIQSGKQIIQKKDTIVFTAKAFVTGNEKVVEDLLRKIPGLTVTENGTVRVGNQEVEKIMIEGDDFFEKGYKLLTKNMLSKPIEKVEIYQNYSNNKHLKNVEYSDKVAINLKLNDESKRQWFGDIEVGYGVASENRYEGHGNLMNFGKRDKYYFITNMNNTGQEAIGDINHLIRPLKTDETSCIADGQNVSAVVHRNDPKPDLKSQRINFNNDQMISLNSIFTLSKKSKLKTILFLNNSRNHSFRNSVETVKFQKTNFQNTENSNGKISNLTGFGKIDFTYDLSNSKSLDYSGKFNLINEKYKRNILFNNNFLDENLLSKNQLMDHKIVFTNKIASTKVLLTTGRFIIEKIDQNYSNQPFLSQEIFMTDARYSQQVVVNKMQLLGFESYFTSKMENKNVLEIKFGNQFRKDNLNSEFSLPDKGIFPQGYQNDFRYQTNDLYTDIRYRFTLKKVNLVIQAEIHQLFNQLRDFKNTDGQSPFFISPKFAFDWNIDKSNKLLAVYRLSKTNTAVVDNFMNFVNTDFRSFQKGTGDFNQLSTSAATINHNYADWSKRFFMNNHISYIKNHDFISTNLYVSESFSKTEKILMHDRNFVNLSSNMEKYFPYFKTNLKASLESSISEFKNSINGSDLRKVKSTNVNYEISLRSGFRGFFNYHFGYNNQHSSVKTTIENNFTNHMAFLDLYFTISKKIDFQIQTERYYFGSIEKQNSTYYFADFEAIYTLKEKNIIFALTGNNLTGTRKFKDYNITDYSISKTEYRLQPRYLIFKISFRF